jgi:hypothetical protein
VIPKVSGCVFGEIGGVIRIALPKGPPAVGSGGGIDISIIRSFCFSVRLGISTGLSAFLDIGEIKAEIPDVRDTCLSVWASNGNDTTSVTR